MLEERYFDFTLMPVVQATGIAEGILEIAIEQTNKVVSTRRMETLAKLSNSLRMMQSFDDEFWGRLVNAFDANPIDSPLIIVYRTASSSSDTVQHLQQSLGVTPGGIFAPYMCMANVSNARNCVFHEEMGAAKEQNKVIIKKFTAEARANGELDGRGFDELPAAAAVIPIQISTKSTRGFLILGLNPRRPLDRGYKIWLESIRKELAAAATGVWMRQKEFTRIIEREKHGAIKQSTLELRAELAKRTEDLQRSELFFSQTAETLPVGLLLVDLEGQIYYTNHTARNLFSVKSHTEMNEMWRPNIYAEDTDRVQEAFDHAVVKRETMYTHYRVGNTGADPGWEYWVAASMFVQVDETTAQVSRFVARPSGPSDAAYSVSGSWYRLST